MLHLQESMEAHANVLVENNYKTKLKENKAKNHVHIFGNVYIMLVFITRRINICRNRLMPHSSLHYPQHFILK